MNESVFKKYRKNQLVEMRPYVKDENMAFVSIAVLDKEAGSPRKGDMIARNPKNYNDQWLVSKKYFEENYEEA